MLHYKEPPPVPDDLHAAQVTARLIRLAWSYPTDALVATGGEAEAGEADTVTSFRVQVRPKPESAFEDIVAPASSAVAAFFPVELNVSVMEACSPHAKNVSLYVCVYNVSDLRPYTEYIIRISAATSIVHSPPSPQYQIRTSEAGIAIFTFDYITRREFTFVLLLSC